MQGRFKMEYRLFTIVRYNYNYRDYNAPSKPNMHAKVKTMQKETSTKSKRTSGRRQDSKKICKKLEGRLPTGGKKAKKR